MSSENPGVDQSRPALASPISRPAPYAGTPLTGRWRLLAICAAIGLMLPTLFFPFGPDSAMFAVGAQRLLEGGLYYRDLIDVKPPLIYYFYAAVQSLFGTSFIAVRVVDLVLQLAVATGLYLMARRRGSERWGALAGLLYLGLYASLGYQNLAQTESLGAALVVGALMVTLRSPRPGGAFVAGLLGGVAAFVKTTFLVILPAAILTDLMREERPRHVAVRNAVAAISGAAAIVALFVLFLMACGLGRDFLLQQQFTRAFVSLHLLNPVEFLDGLTSRMVAGLGETLSLPVVIAGAFAVGAATIRRTLDGPTETQRELLRAATVWSLLLLGSIIAEARYHPYHFIRLMPLAALLAAWPLDRLFTWRFGDRTRREPFGMGLAVVLIGLSLAMMPVARWIWYSVPSLQFALGRYDRFEAYYSRAGYGYALREHREVAEILRGRGLANASLFVASGVASHIYHAVGVAPRIPFLHSTFYTAPWSPPEWRAGIAAEFLSRPPDALVLAPDAHIELNASPTTSEQGLRSISPVDSLIRADYRLVGSTPSFDVYQRVP